MSNCRNCGEELPHEARFCFVCGQSTRVLARPWNEVFRELLDELLDLDGRMLSSLRLLFTRPGQLSHDYNRGRRMSQTPPLRMYLLISLAFFFVLPMILPESQYSNQGHRFSVDLYSKGMFLLLPLFALLLKLFFRRYFYLEHLVYTTYLFSFMFIVFAVMMAIETAADRYLAVMLLQILLLIYTIFYFIASLRKCYDESWPKSGLKAFGLLFIFLPLLGITIELASHSGA